MMFNGLIFFTGAMLTAILNGQDVRFDYQLAVPTSSYSRVAHEPDPAPGQTFVAIDQPRGVATGAIAHVKNSQTGVSDQPKKRITFKQNRVTIQELLAALAEEGVQLISPFDEETNERFSVNLVDQPVEVVMRALGRAMRGTWTQDGAVWVFEAHSAATYFGGYPAAPFPNPPQGPVSTSTTEVIRYGTPETFSPFVGANQATAFPPLLVPPSHKKLLNSITLAQQRLHAKQGFLKISDLSKTQRALINAEGTTGHLMIQFDRSGKATMITSMSYGTTMPNAPGSSR